MNQEEKPKLVITRELVDVLWPEHGRTSCSDTNTENGYPHYENGAPRCCRCMGLESINEPLEIFKIEATIRIPPDPKVVREKALAKLTPEERRVLGI